MIEAEIKARVRDPVRVRALLRARADEHVSRYRDTYYDWPSGQLTEDGRELRIRVIEAHGQRQCLLTYKGQAIDAESGSKPETETRLTDAEAADTILLALGFTHLVAFEKQCANYSFTAAGRRILATLVTVPELDGMFVEVETLAGDPGDLSPALDAVRGVLTDLGIPEQDLTSELYTDAVMRHRNAGNRGR